MSARSKLLAALAAIVYEACVRVAIAAVALTAGVAAGAVAVRLGVWS